jgi:type IV secretory pathway VirJ component
MRRCKLIVLMLMLLASARAAATDISDLPLVEVRAQRGSDLLAVFFSGDGGWAGLDRGVSARLAAAGVPVVGVNSLRYFWSERSPEKAAEDLARVLHHYLADGRAETRVLLIGYSTGADVLPFLVNRLPQDLRRRIASMSLIAPGHEAVFKIYPLEWIRKKEPRGAPLLPEIERLSHLPLLCMYGQGDDSALCPALPPQYATVTPIGKGHHLGGEYEAIAERILSFSRPE